MRKVNWVRILLAMVAVGCMVAPGPSANAQSKSLRWLRWDAEIQVNVDGSMDVREVYEVSFLGGPFTFGFRDIPRVQYEDLTDFRVREGGVEYDESSSQSANTFYVSRDSGEYVVNWFYPPTTDETRTFVVEYRVLGGLFISEELGDRVFWKAVGPDHDFPIESSTVVVSLPGDATVAVDTDEPSAFGPSSPEITIAGDRRSVTYFGSPIPSGTAFEVGVYFPHGYVSASPPSWQAAYEREQAWNESGRPIFNLLLGGIGLLLLVAGPGAVYLLWLFRGRDPESGAVPSHLTEPPSDLPPGLAGTLVDEKADLQDIMATLVDLARRGVIEMEEKERKLFGLSTSKEFGFRKLDYKASGLRGYEELLVTSLFGRKDEIELSDLKERFYTYVPKLQRELYKDIVAEGYFPASPQAVRGRYLGLGIGALVVSVGCGLFLAAGLGGVVEAILCPFLSLAVASVALIAVSGVMPAKTREGALEAEKWKAFKQFLKNTERYGDVEAFAEKFDQYLPYAIAFGLERTWIDRFARVATTPMPGWYIPYGYPGGYGRRGLTRSGPGSMGSGGRAGGDLRDQAVRPGGGLDSMSEGMFGGLSSMSSGLFSMLNSTSRAFTSVPHSSGSSSGGFSGGGFSGGFSGGGGGGGGGAGFG